MTVYLIGSLRNPQIPIVAAGLRAHNIDCFDDWFSAGPTADDAWQSYCKARGQSYETALLDHAAQHIFRFDRHHLDRCDAGVLVAPAGRSAYLELGYIVGSHKPGFILLREDFDRWDVMGAFATVCRTFEDLVENLRAL